MVIITPSGTIIWLSNGSTVFFQCTKLEGATRDHKHLSSASSNIQHHYYSTEPDQLWDSPAPYISQKHGSSSFEFRSMDSISCTETISLSG
ncbi:hypothetical protein Peur_051459 [Populus x canadensis]